MLPNESGGRGVGSGGFFLYFFIGSERLKFRVSLVLPHSLPHAFPRCNFWAEHIHILDH